MSDPAAPSEAAASYLQACADTHKAWHATSMLARARLEHIERLRTLLREGDAVAIAAAACEMAGDLHPGLGRLQASQAGAAWTRKASQLAQAALAAILAPAVAMRQSSPGREALGLVDLDGVKQWVAHWIDHGCLPPAADQDLAREAAQIARWLDQVCEQDALRHGACGPNLGARRAQWQRLAVIACTAPAIESMRIMGALDAGYLQTLRAAGAAPGGYADQPDVTPCGPHGLDVAHSGPMARSDRDDAVANDAFERLAAGG